MHGAVSFCVFSGRRFFMPLVCRRNSHGHFTNASRSLAFSSKWEKKAAAAALNNLARVAGMKWHLLPYTAAAAVAARKINRETENAAKNFFFYCMQATNC
jgi:hypothetical protein